MSQFHVNPLYLKAHVSIVKFREGSLTALMTNPDSPDHWHDGVVDDVEAGQLAVLLLQHHEERVHEVRELGEEVPPHNVGGAEDENTLVHYIMTRDTAVYLSPSTELV